MLDFVTVFTNTGLTLWSHLFAPSVKGSPVNELIRNVLIEERSGKTSYIVDQYVLKWSFANDLGLIFVAGHNKHLLVPYVETLLEAVKQSFCQNFIGLLKDQSKLHEYPFDPLFQQINNQCEQIEEAPRTQRTFQDSKKNKEKPDKSALKNDQDEPNKKPKKKVQLSDDEPPELVDMEEQLQQQQRQSSPQESEPPSSPSQAPLTREQILEKLKKKSSGKLVKSEKPNNEPVAEDTTKKMKRPADSKGGKMSKEEIAKLNYSDPQEGEYKVPEHLVDKEAMEKLKKAAGGNFQLPDIEYKPKEKEVKDTSATGRLTSFFKSLATGQKVLERSDLELPLAKMKDLLISKNVATEISESLCESVLQSLEAKTVSSFTGVATIVRESMENALQRILTPKKSTDLLREIMDSKEQKLPFSIVFCGVNGVGKSTNLAKICFWLLQNKCSVLIAACDTFRSGAVEQLNVHVKNLKALGVDSESPIELYQQGYGKDAAEIAKNAIAYAKAKRYDVILIDTAGRMQDNELLMRALAKLVRVNTPNKVFFVGEALVGNDGVDQLVKFNQALKDFSDTVDPRQIDGIVLTKFDTIDDKVGAALSMTYATSQPIVFVGTGQTYTDLKKLNVKAVVDSLLS